MKPLEACRYLQNKAFFFPPLAGERSTAEDALATGCWCLRTHEPTGPDDGDVTLEECVGGRSCFSPEVEL